MVNFVRFIHLRNYSCFFTFSTEDKQNDCNDGSDETDCKSYQPKGDFASPPKLGVKPIKNFVRDGDKIIVNLQDDAESGNKILNDE